MKFANRGSIRNFARVEGAQAAALDIALVVLLVLTATAPIATGTIEIEAMIDSLAGAPEAAAETQS